MALEGWGLVLAGVGIVGSTVGITKLMLNSAVKAISGHCAEQKAFCTKWHTDGKEDREALWNRVNGHSHKALDQNGGKVVI